MAGETNDTVSSCSLARQFLSRSYGWVSHFVLFPQLLSSVLVLPIEALMYVTGRKSAVPSWRGFEVFHVQQDSILEGARRHVFVVRQGVGTTKLRCSLPHNGDAHGTTHLHTDFCIQACFAVCKASFTEKSNMHALDGVSAKAAFRLWRSRLLCSNSFRS